MARISVTVRFRPRVRVKVRLYKGFDLGFRLGLALVCKLGGSSVLELV